MKPIKGYNDAKASGDFERLPAGGYVIKITAVKDLPANEYLRIIYDIAEGPEAGRYKNEGPDNDFWHSFIRSYKGSALGMLKAFLQAVDETNGTKLGETVETGLDEQQLVGKILGAVFGYEEYETNAGDIKQRLYIKSCKTAEQIRKGDFTVPAFKPLPGKKASAGSVPEGFSPITDEDVPF
jgi:hypothetical protein